MDAPCKDESASENTLPDMSASDSEQSVLDISADVADTVLDREEFFSNALDKLESCHRFASLLSSYFLI